MANRFLSLKDHVYNYISEKIGNGTLEAESKINEQMICDELSISRTPVREALIQLASEGYLENLPRKGFIVKQIDEKKAKELYEIIGTLEGLSAFLAFDSITEKEISRMRYYISSMDLAINSKSSEIYYKQQLEFHDVYISLCGNTELIDLLNQLKKHFMRQNYTIANNEDIYKVLKDTNNEHMTIVELFEKGKKNEISDYLKNVHWNPEKARFDLF